MKANWKQLIFSLLLLFGTAISVCVSAQIDEKKTKETMVLIPGAIFEMGQGKDDIPKLQEIFKIGRAELFAEEVPKHRVKLSSLYLDKYEVTNAEFKRFLDSNPDWRKDRVPAELHNGKYLSDWNVNDFPSGKANYPVVFVNWHAAVAYCQAQGKRLPTEAEWEFAARGGRENKVFPWGDEMPDKTRVNFGESGFGAAVAVGSYPANGHGLFDMAGNVWEFLADEWAAYSGQNKLQVNPVAGGDFFLSETYRQVKTRRAIRGGSYGAGPVNLRVTYRDSHLPTNAGDHVGFRCAKNAK
jgi:formylglycine-generating enzyme required for sulfatase activity